MDFCTNDPYFWVTLSKNSDWIRKYVQISHWLLSVSKITYLPLSTGHNNKGNPLIGVEHSFFIFIIPKGTKQVRYY